MRLVELVVLHLRYPKENIPLGHQDFTVHHQFFRTHHPLYHMPCTNNSPILIFLLPPPDTLSPTRLSPASPPSPVFLPTSAHRAKVAAALLNSPVKRHGRRRPPARPVAHAGRRHHAHPPSAGGETSATGAVAAPTFPLFSLPYSLHDAGWRSGAGQGGARWHLPWRAMVEAASRGASGTRSRASDRGG
jgi:hypothetical protein